MPRAAYAPSPEVSPRSFAVTLLLAMFLGGVGGHWFYLSRPGLGLLRLAPWLACLALVALSALGVGSVGGSEVFILAALASAITAVWSLVDIILVATHAARDGQGRRLP